MIIRKKGDTFIFIEQNHHAHVAANIIASWQEAFLLDDPLRESVLYAIKNHDVGWDYFDQEPFWNDAKNAPYAFTDFPLLSKLIIYTYGVDVVEAVDPYAAALCSAHYSTFLNKHTRKEVLLYLTKEAKRREQILKEYTNVTEKGFGKHLALLQLADNLSLFICLHESGNSDERRHPFFKHGIPYSTDLGFGDDVIQPTWIAKNTLRLSGLPLANPITIKLQEKMILIDDIHQNGLLHTYLQAEKRTREVRLETTN